ncbi:VanZ family protein [Alkalibacillus filiformis]|uniref:VanZ family protein n=1 Tax=Alkalibacillus filiformis TaxID=200990 RepID=A0ABU0DWA1_9BACI|nr:VanZ family protein [Alkalibacillus filiformis]MDQ0352748.1 VanZ family protein [Alkalibacillus filiformis]
MKKIVSWLAVLMWMGLIFYFSHQPGEESSELSGSVVEIVLSIVPFIDADTEWVHIVIRKGAHFFVYFILGVLVINALRISGVKLKRSVWVSILVCLLYAISDEVHQLYIPGRSGEVSDVVLDTVGASFGMLIYLVFYRLITRGE